MQREYNAVKSNEDTESEPEEIIEEYDSGDDDGLFDEDDEETYMEGGIWFDGKQIEDYDGCFELPEEVVAALNELGYSIDD